MSSTFARTSLALATTALLSACSTKMSDPKQLEPSALSTMQSNQAVTVQQAQNQSAQLFAGGYQNLQSLSFRQGGVQSSNDLSVDFPDNGNLDIKADKMPGDQLIHTVFGEQLQVNYVIADGIANLAEPFSLNIRNDVTPRQLFVLVSELLASRQIAITKRDDVYFIHPADPAAVKSGVLGYGRNAEDVPNVPGVITQLVPVLYNLDISIERTVMELTNVQVMQATGQSAYYFRGERDAILRALEILHMLDNPSARGRHVGLLRLTYLPIKEFSEKIIDLLASEGLQADLNKPANKNLVLIPLEQIGAVALFASDKIYIERVNYWATQLDKPAQTNDRQFFMFYPRYARAADLGKSVAALIGAGSNQSGNQSRDTRSAQPAANQSAPAPVANASNVAAGAASRDTVTSVRTDSMSLTVDERANALIFHTTGKEYQMLLPMIQRLDTMPKQIVLEAMIAEVTLTDEFQFGVEFALKNQRFNFDTTGAFGIKDIGGIGFSWSDKAGIDKLLGKASQKDGRLNVISRPSIVVRDGVTANISVGTDLPIVTATTTNPLDPDALRQINSQGYRKTGVMLSVTPTISAQGLVMMEIDQSISNQADLTAEAGSNPAILERKLKTEVIAQSGQTILLGGLMSEDKNSSETKVPFFGDLPVIGNLFKTQKDKTTKTELILLITPRVLDDTKQWQGIRQKMSEGMQLMKLPEEKTSN